MSRKKDLKSTQKKVYKQHPLKTIMKKNYFLFILVLIITIIILIVFSKNNLLKSPDEDETSGKDPEEFRYQCPCETTDSERAHVFTTIGGITLSENVNARYVGNSPCPIVFNIGDVPRCFEEYKCEKVLQITDPANPDSWINPTSPVYQGPGSQGQSGPGIKLPKSKLLACLNKAPALG